jgi:uncharacterized protein YegL
MRRILSLPLPLAIVLAVGACEEEPSANVTDVGAVDWAAVVAWPPGDIPADVTVEAMPDPNRTVTVIVLDDSGSMGGAIEPAKRAVLTALDTFSAADRVGIVALNHGLILPVTDVAAARATAPEALARVAADGSTPLGRAFGEARSMLEREAFAAQGYGTYRILATTDGAANDADTLVAEVRHAVTATPIQISTIGIGVGDRHVLNLPGVTTYVAIENVDGLAAALQGAIAEAAVFVPPTAFTETP